MGCLHIVSQYLTLLCSKVTLFLFDRKEAVTLPGIREMNVADIEQSLQFSNTGTTTGFQHNAYFTMVYVSGLTAWN